MSALAHALEKWQGAYPSLFCRSTNPYIHLHHSVLIPLSSTKSGAINRHLIRLQRFDRKKEMI